MVLADEAKGSDIFLILSENIDKVWRREWWKEESKAGEYDTGLKLTFANNNIHTWGRHFRKEDIEICKSGCFFFLCHWLKKLVKLSQHSPSYCWVLDNMPLVKHLFRNSYCKVYYLYAHIYFKVLSKGNNTLTYSMSTLPSYTVCVSYQIYIFRNVPVLSTPRMGGSD